MQLVSFICAVILSITDVLRLETGALVTAEVARLLLMKVEVESPPGLAGVCAGGVQEVPVVDSQGKLPGVIEVGEDRDVVHGASHLPSVLLAGVHDLGLDVAQQVPEVAGKENNSCPENLSNQENIYLDTK